LSAAVLTIGTELTRGELTNTNASWLSEQLTWMGADVEEHLTVPDDVAQIRDAVRHLAQRHAVIVGTGGLGPTTDDMTAQSVADAAGVRLVRHEPSVEAIRRRFASVNREMSPSNAKQADLPETSTALENPVGTAPGFSIALGKCQCFFLPGVPHEMKRLFVDHVQPALAPAIERRTHQVIVRTFGLPESVVGERLSGVEAAFPGITLGYRASFPEIEVKVLARAANAAEAEELAGRVTAEVKARLDDAVYGEGEDNYPEFVGRTLRDRGLTLAIAESCTGGMVGSLITDAPGSSDYLLLDAVTYSNAAKTQVLGVSSEILRAYGAVSAECATAMADGARRVADADIAVSITGIAGPGGGSDGRPVGTVWIGVARKDRETAAEHHKLGGDRSRIRCWAAYLALRTIVRAARDT
jgi:nicotinamide-nucleotide amidase